MTPRVNQRYKIMRKGVIDRWIRIGIGIRLIRTRPDMRRQRYLIKLQYLEEPQTNFLLLNKVKQDKLWLRNQYGQSNNRNYLWYMVVMHLIACKLAFPDIKMRWSSRATLNLLKSYSIWHYELIKQLYHSINLLIEA